jgi:hypothetical protein
MANVANKGTFATYGGANLNEIFYEPVFRSDDLIETTELYLMLSIK